MIDQTKKMKSVQCQERPTNSIERELVISDMYCPCHWRTAHTQVDCSVSRTFEKAKTTLCKLTDRITRDVDGIFQLVPENLTE